MRDLNIDRSLDRSHGRRRAKPCQATKRNLSDVNVIIRAYSNATVPARKGCSTKSITCTEGVSAHARCVPTTTVQYRKRSMGGSYRCPCRSMRMYDASNSLSPTNYQRHKPNQHNSSGPPACRTYRTIIAPAATAPVMITTSKFALWASAAAM